jgi:hypothetical protein
MANRKNKNKKVVDDDDKQLIFEFEEKRLNTQDKSGKSIPFSLLSAG